MFQIQPVFASRDKADLGPGLAPLALIHFVGVAVGLCREAFVVDHPRFLFGGIVTKADIQPTCGHVKLRRHQLHPVDAAINNACGLNSVLHGFQPHPQAGKPRQTIAIDPVVHNFLHARRANHGHIGIHHRPFGLVQNGRTFAGVVIAHRHKDATVF